jgi:hypothetical protein
VALLLAGRTCSDRLRPRAEGTTGGSRMEARGPVLAAVGDGRGAYGQLPGRHPYRVIAGAMPVAPRLWHDLCLGILSDRTCRFPAPAGFTVRDMIGDVRKR